MILMRMDGKEKRMKPLLSQAWVGLDELNCELRKLQNEVNDDNLETTINLIEQKPLIDDIHEDALIEYLTLILVEVLCYIAEIVDEQNTLVSDCSVDALKNIRNIMMQFQMTTKILRSTHDH